MHKLAFGELNAQVHVCRQAHEREMGRAPRDQTEVALLLEARGLLHENQGDPYDQANACNLVDRPQRIATRRKPLWPHPI